jgi:hypothetical protein
MSEGGACWLAGCCKQLVERSEAKKQQFPSVTVLSTYMTIFTYRTDDNNRQPVTQNVGMTIIPASPL